VLYRLDRVAVGFAGRAVLRGLSLQQNPGEKLVLLGRNGCGKTTLLRVILGELEPDAGSVERARGLEIAHLEQRLATDAGMTAFEFALSAFPRVLAIEGELARLEAEPAPHDESSAAALHHLHEEYDRLDGYRVRPRAQAALEGLGVGRELQQRALASLSGGERTRTALARALLTDAPLLLLDEPTNHLDLVGVEFLAQQLALRTGAILLVTHDRELVDRIGGEIVELHGGRAERCGAGYARYRREREQRRALARKAWELQQAEISRQEEFIRRNIAGQNTRQAQARQKMLARLERLEAPEADLPAIKLRWPAIGRSGERVLEAERLELGWEDTLLRDVGLIVRRGERIAVVGRNGAGKTTLLHVLAGRLPARAGRLRYGQGVAPGWYDQDQADVPTGCTVLDVLLAARPEWTPAEARTWAGRFGFSGESADALTDTLSGGERARLALARLIALGPNLMLLDEPTNHLDLATCEVLEAALQQFPGAVVLVSHDRRLVERVATGVLLIEEGTATPVNTVAEAFARLGLTRATEEKPAAAGVGVRRSAAAEERRRLKRDSARTQERAAALAAEIEQGEARLSEIEALLCEREIFSDAARSRALAAEAEALRPAVDVLIERWVEAEEDASALAARLAELEASDSPKT
jgi:ATP-binding cassette subfamily F protein 3